MPEVHIAMWSGPRNISTALMRAFSARGDCDVVDEPLYAHYLDQTGLDHPGRADVLASQPSAWEDVAARLTAPGGAPVRYVKHMAHHLLPDIDRGWLGDQTHAFLVRDPAAMVVSLARVLPYEPSLVDTGLPQQVELHEAFGGPVVAAEDVLDAPAAVLEPLCGALGIPWVPAMLSWPAGPHPADGVWGTHWYSSVWASTGFEQRTAGTTVVPAHLEALVEAAIPLHERLWRHRLVAQ